MKKILIALGLLALLMVALLPAGVGFLVQSNAKAELREEIPDATIDWRRGWTRSTVAVNAEAWRAALRLRHTPLSPPGWLSAEGRVTLLEPPAVIDVRGRVTPAFGLMVRADAPSIRFDGPVGWSAEQPRLRLDAHGERSIRLDLDLAGVLGADGLGNRLSLNPAGLGVEIRPEDARFDQALIELHVTRAGQPPSQLRIRMTRLDHDALVRLWQSTEQLMAAKPNSGNASLAMIGVASAWGELATGGMEVELQRFVLDGGLELTGRWTPATRDFVLRGGGPAAPALGWTAAIIGLDRAISPEQARAEADALLGALADQKALVLNDGVITVRLGPAAR